MITEHYDIPATDYARTDAGLFVPYFYVAKPKRPTHFDFFAGAGGFGCGVVQAGFETIGANEYDATASITYMVNLGHYPMNIHYLDGDADKNRLEKALINSYSAKGLCDKKGNFPKDAKINPADLFNCTRAGSGYISHHPELDGCKNFWLGDIRKLTGKMILDTLGLKQGDIDLVTGGPPCQGFSKAGKQQIDDSRNPLVYEYARMIVELQPKTFVMEEVPDVVNFYDPDGVPVLDKFCLMLQEGGYGKWDMIKKSIAMQAGTAGVIKDELGRHKKMLNRSGKRSKDSRKVDNNQAAKQSREPKQINLFEIERKMVT